MVLGFTGFRGVAAWSFWDGDSGIGVWGGVSDFGVGL